MSIADPPSDDAYVVSPAAKPLRPIGPRGDREGILGPANQRIAAAALPETAELRMMTRSHLMAG